MTIGAIKTIEILVRPFQMDGDLVYFPALGTIGYRIFAHEIEWLFEKHFFFFLVEIIVRKQYNEDGMVLILYKQPITFNDSFLFQSLGSILNGLICNA